MKRAREFPPGSVVRTSTGTAYVRCQNIPCVMRWGQPIPGSEDWLVELVGAPVPLDVPWGQIDLSTHSLSGWPDRADCPHCAGELCLLVATYDGASYECRGSLPHPAGSAYTDDRCHGARSVQRYERVEPEPECEHGHTRPDPDSDEWLCDDCGQRIFTP